MSIKQRGYFTNVTWEHNIDQITSTVSRKTNLIFFSLLNRLLPYFHTSFTSCYKATLKASADTSTDALDLPRVCLPLARCFWEPLNSSLTPYLPPPDCDDEVTAYLRSCHAAKVPGESTDQLGIKQSVLLRHHSGLLPDVDHSSWALKSFEEFIWIIQHWSGMMWGKWAEWM